MALNFPNNPQINEEYISGTTTWIWNGLDWRVKPIQGIATVEQVNNIFATPATTSTLGTVKVDGTTILIDANGVISAVGGGGGGGGVDLTAFSIAPEPAPAGNGSLTYNNTDGIFTYTPPDLSGYLTSYTETDTLTSVTSRGSTTDNAITINNLLSASSLTVSTTAAITGNLTASANLTVGDTLYTTNIVNTGTGVPRWTSGSDFIIDAAGDVNVVGSKITNVADPTQLQDAATKAYVDSAASAFNGGTVSGAINITNTTQSTDKDTGALIVNGGAGIENDVYVGGIVYVFDTITSTYSPVLTSSSGGYNGGIISGTVFINNSTASSSTTTGALRVLGGAGFGGVLNVGSDSFFNGIKIGRGAGPSLGSNTNVALGGGTGNDTPLAVNITGARNIAIGYKTIAGSNSASDNVAVGFNAMANKTNGNFNVAVGAEALMEGTGGSNTAIGAGALALATGDTNTALGHDALHNAEGSGNIGVGFIAGRDLVTGNYNVILGNNDGLLIDGTDNNILICDGQGNIRISADSTGTVTIPGSTESSSTTTGALVISGGVGIVGALNIGSTVTVTSSSNSSSTNTGSIVTLGGMGVAGNVYASGFYGDGSGLTNITATGFSGGTVTGLTSFTFTGTGSAATSTTTGAVRISGGLGVQGRVHAGNFNGVVVPSASTAPGANAFVRTDGSGYTYTNYINSNTTLNENPIVNQIVVTNSSDNFYRKSSLANLATYLQPSLRAAPDATGGGTITVNASASVLWSARFIVISQGNGSTYSTTGYFDITCPTSGTITGVGGAASRSATAAGIVVNAWETLYYILPMGSANTSATANFRIASYLSALEVPYNWLPVVRRNGDDGTFNFCNGIRLRLSESATASLVGSAYPQFSSLGVGTAASSTTGEIRATNNITAYFSDDRLKTRLGKIENALDKVDQLAGFYYEPNQTAVDLGYEVKREVGVSAQDVNKIMPEIVAPAPIDDRYLTVRYEKLAPLLIEAIKELRSELNEIKKRLD